MWVCDMCAAKMVVAKKIEPFSQAYGIGRDAFGNVNYYSGHCDCCGDGGMVVYHPQVTREILQQFMPPNRQVTVPPGLKEAFRQMGNASRLKWLEENFLCCHRCGELDTDADSCMCNPGYDI